MSTAEKPDLPQYTFDAFVLGAVTARIQSNPRITAKTAVKEAFAAAHKRGFTIPETFKEFC